MTIFEIGLRTLTSRFANVSPFCYVYTPFPKSFASFWTGVFGVPDESSNERAFVLSAIINYITRFNRVNDLLECRDTFYTYFFDFANQQLYINYGLLYSPRNDATEYLKQFGFCDENVVYIDDFEYLPLLKDSIKISSQQDLINGTKLAMATGAATLLNQGKQLDFINGMTLFSNDAVVYHLEQNAEGIYTREDLEPIAYMLIDDIKNSMQGGKITLQDIRASLNVKVPTDLFSADDYPDAEEGLYDKPIPWLFGANANEVPAICTNGTLESGVVTYRVARELQALGDVYIDVDGAWTLVTPTSVDLVHGEFILSEADGRGASGESARDCKVIGAQGYTVTHATDVIIKLEQLANGIEFTDSNYDLTEWAAEAASLAPISVYLDEQKNLHDIIKLIQEGSSARFRFDFNASGLRTIRLNNWSRTPCDYIYKEDYLENGEIELETDRETIAAYIKVSYNKNCRTKKYSTVIDQSKVNEVVRSSRTKQTIEYDTFIETREVAIARAADDATKLGRITKFCELTLLGKKRIFRRIYDVITVELYAEDRKWMGIWNCLVIKVAPDVKLYQTKVKLALLEKIGDLTEVVTIRIDESGNIRTADTDNTTIKVV